MNALSKSFAMTGWRIGWIVGPADLMEQVAQIKASMTGSTALFAQFAAWAALTGPQDELKRVQDLYTRRRRLVLDALDDMHVPYATPQGGQFLFADISFTGMDCIDFSQRVLEEEQVLIFPGSGFTKGWDDYVRITFLQPEEELREGLARMKRALARIEAK